MRGPEVKAPVSEGDMLADKYRVDRILGAGGMGVVVAATHAELDQKVAIKFLLPHMVENSDLVRRFMREGRLAGKLKSEHVAKVIDVGRLADGAPYMVLEYLEGKDLSEVLKEQGPLPVQVAVQFILQAIEAVAEAHATKLIHRDLKPQNLFLTHRVNGEPLVKVLDFGISKALEEASAEFALTRSQSLLGSPLYMSPEQMRSSKAVDERSDIWSIGVLLHELLTSRHPFEADTIPGLVFQVTMEDPTPIRAHRPEVDPGLETVIAHCLKKKKEERYSNLAELAKDLEPFGGDASRGVANSIASVLRAPSSPRASFSSFSDISGVHSTDASEALGATMDASDPQLAKQLEQSAAGLLRKVSQPGLEKDKLPDPTGAASAWGNTQGGVGTAPPTKRPLWIYAVAALLLVGVGVGAGSAFRPSPAGPSASSTVSAQNAFGTTPSTPSPDPSSGGSAAAGLPSTSGSTGAAPTSSASSAVAKGQPSGSPSTPPVTSGKPAGKPVVGAKPGPGPTVAEPQPTPAPTPTTKPTAKPAASGPPGFVPFE
jgi:serine/threonine protein kinase